MPKCIPIGVDNFAKLVNPANNYLFADKTALIKEIIDDGSEVILITRPRRWGKSLNISMLEYFFASEVFGHTTKGLFDNCAIANIENGRYLAEHQGQYPVISVSFKDIKESNFAETLIKIKLLFQRLFGQYDYLATSDQLNTAEIALFNKYLHDTVHQSELEDALVILSQLLFKHFKKPVYILIDEYDTPLNTAYKHGYIGVLTSFIKNLLSAALKGNVALKKGILTGILRISKDNMLSGLNNLEVYTSLHKKYNHYFGFTSAELDPLFADQQLIKNEERVKTWYNGYRIGDLTLYNPWSIMCSLKNGGALEPYWINTADDSLLREILQGASAEIKIKFQQLLEGKLIEGLISQTIRYEDITADEISLWSLLLYTGYLTAYSMTSQGTYFLCQLKIPNQEVRALYDDCFLGWMNALTQQNQLKSLLHNLTQGLVEKFVNDVEHFLLTAASIHDYAKQPEAFYHGFILALTAGLLDDYYIDSNRESGLGRPDLLFIPKNTQQSQAIILEFKHVPKRADPETIATQALKQIDLQAYSTKIKQHHHINQIIQVGLAFDGKKVYCQHVIT